VTLGGRRGPIETFRRSETRATGLRHGKLRLESLCHNWVTLGMRVEVVNFSPLRAFFPPDEGLDFGI
jgi:hypothetical protein